MTDPAAASPDPRSPASYLQAWADAVSQAMGEIAGVPLPCTLLAETPPEAPAAGETDLWVIAACSGGLRGEMSLRLPPVTIVRFAQILMNEPAAPGEANGERREAALELLRQVSGLAATELKATWGELQLRLESAAAAPSWPASSSGWFRVGEEVPAMLMEAHMSAALVASVRAEKSEAVEAPVGSTPASASSHDETVNLGLLMDVELGVTLRFGSRRLLLRELLDLNPGTVITLDRQIHEPVDMLLDGRVVARGEVVVTGGNYALRVTEVGPGGL